MSPKVLHDMLFSPDIHEKLPAHGLSPQDPPSTPLLETSSEEKLESHPSEIYPDSIPAVSVQLASEDLLGLLSAAGHTDSSESPTAQLDSSLTTTSLESFPSHFEDKLSKAGFDSSPAMILESNTKLPFSMRDLQSYVQLSFSSSSTDISSPPSQTSYGQTFVDIVESRLSNGSRVVSYPFENVTSLTISSSGEGGEGVGRSAVVSSGVSLSPMAVHFLIVGALFGTVLVLGLVNILLHLRRTGQMRRALTTLSYLCDHRIRRRHHRYYCRSRARGMKSIRGTLAEKQNNHRTTVRMKANHSPFV